MTFAIHGISVSSGIAIGRAVVVASSHLDVAHYFVDADQVKSEIARLRTARDAVVAELLHIQKGLQTPQSSDVHVELNALLDVHLMLLQDEQLSDDVVQWIVDRRYNAEWALMTQLEAVSRQFDDMPDAYLRERKTDLSQVVERVLRFMHGAPTLPQMMRMSNPASRKVASDVSLDDDVMDVPLVLVAHDLSPADMLQFKQSVFAGFVTDVGGKTSHTAIVARSMDIPASVGARTASQLIAQDDWVIIDGDTGIVIVDPSPIILAEYGFRQRQGQVERERLHRLRHTPAVTLDGESIELLANIESASDTATANEVGADGVGLFRSEFLFMGRHGVLPNEEEQLQAYVAVVKGMQGKPVTIRTVDIGADKPLDRSSRTLDEHLNPALGLRAIRWSLSEPAMFLTQIRAILRAAAHGPVHMLIPMLSHISEIRQTLALIEKAKQQLRQKDVAFGEVQIGAMIEVPAAAILVPVFVKYFDFLSVGTNDLIQYTLAIDRVDELVAHLYDPMHPAVLQLLALIFECGRKAGKLVSVCGEMAGDPGMTRLLLGLGLRSFSMHPSQILAVKQQVLRSDTVRLDAWAHQIMMSEEPALAAMQFK